MEQKTAQEKMFGTSPVKFIGDTEIFMLGVDAPTDHLPSSRSRGVDVTPRVEAETPALSESLTQQEDAVLLRVATEQPYRLTDLGIDRVASLRARWKSATNHIIMGGAACVVDLDSDYSLEGDPGEYVGRTKLTVFGDCPVCFHTHDTQDNEWEWEARPNGSEWAVCECGSKFEILSGVPVEYRR